MQMSARRSFLYFLVPSILIGVGGIAIAPVTTYFLDPHDFGVFAILGAFLLPISAIATTGPLPVYIANYLSVIEEGRRVLLFILLIVELAVRSGGAVIAWTLALFVLPVAIREFEPMFILYFRMLVITFVAGGFWAVLSGYLVLHHYARTHARFEFVQWSISALVVVAGLAVFRLGVVSLFLGPLVASVATAGASIWFMRRHVTVRIERRWIRESWRIGIPTVLTSAFELVSGTLDRYFIQRWVDLTQLGFYGFSQGFRGIFTAGMKAFNRTYVPLLLPHLVSTGDLISARRMIKLWYGLIGIAGVWVTLFVHEAIALLTHGKFVVAAPLVPLWFLLLHSMTFGTTFVTYLTLRKRNDLIAALRIGVGVVFIGAMAIAVWRYGIIGAAVTAVLLNFTVQIVYRFAARRIGCPAVGEREFFASAIAVLLVYGTTFVITLSWQLRLVEALLVSAFIARWSGLDVVTWQTLHRIWKRGDLTADRGHVTF